jgi:hypothetical protein
MKKQATNRMYNYPDSELYVQCIEHINYAKRDIQDFETYSFSKERVAKFEQACKVFAELPTDDELLGVQMQMTEKKAVVADKLKIAIRSVMTRVAMKYHNKSGRYRRFGTRKMGDMNDPQLLFCARRVIRVGHQMLPFLNDVGLSEVNLDTVREAMVNFENAIHIQKDKVSDRDIMVEKRTDLGNELYEELIVLCNIGKDIWIDKDTVKYEQYVIYESNADQKRLKRERDKAAEKAKVEAKVAEALKDD